MEHNQKGKPESPELYGAETLFKERGQLANCAKRRSAENNILKAKLAEYQRIVKDLNIELFTSDCNLKPEFLEKFNALDIHRLALAFRDDADPPGEGLNNWPLWNSRYPHHTAVEWATYWHFWVALLLRNTLQGLSKRRLVVQTQLPEDFLRQFSGEDIRQLLRLLRDVHISPEEGTSYWKTFAQTHPNHREDDWCQLWLSWLLPMTKSYDALIKSNHPVGAEAGKYSSRPGQKSDIGGQVPVAGIWNKRGPLTVLAQKYGPSVSFDPILL